MRKEGRRREFWLTGDVLAIFGGLLVERALVILALAIAVLLVAAVAHEVGYDAEEGELLVVGGETLVFWKVETPGPIEIEYVTEELGIAVEKVLVGLLVEEELLLDRAEQRLRVLLERRAPAFEPVAAYVYHDLFVLPLLQVFDRRRRKWIFFKSNRFIILVFTFQLLSFFFKYFF